MTIWDPISILKVGRQRLCTQNQQIKEQKSKRESERTKGKQWSSLETKVWVTGAPIKLELDIETQDGK